MRKMNAIEVSHLTKRFGDKVALMTCRLQSVLVKYSVCWVRMVRGRQPRYE